MSKFGFQPQQQSLQVQVRPNGSGSGPLSAVHSRPHCPADVKWMPVPDGAQLPAARLLAARRQAPTDGRTPTGFKGRPLLQDLRSSKVRIEDPQLDYDYSVLAANEHAYWFCVYHKARASAQISKDRKSSKAATRSAAWAELSPKELGLLAPYIPGLEIIYDHQAGKRTLGCVVDYYLTKASDSLYVLIRPYPTEEGRLLCKQIESGALRGCSLAHARQGSRIQLNEVSLCSLGARDGTVYVSTVDVQGEKRPRVFDRTYQSPPFVVQASSSAGPLPASMVQESWMMYASTPEYLRSCGLCVVQVAENNDTSAHCTETGAHCHEQIERCDFLLELKQHLTQHS